VCERKYFGQLTKEAKQIDAEDGEALANVIVAVLKFHLHNRSVYFDCYNGCETCEDHLATWKE
jgi:hypothetical protein